MRITISGPPGSGKTTVCGKLSEALGLKAVVFGQVFRQLAAEKGLTLVELGKLAEQDPQIDADIDAKIVETARSSPDIILESRLSAYMLTRNGIPALRVFLEASPEVRFARIGIREEQELQHAIEKAVILSDGGMISAEDIDGGNQQRKEKPLEEVQTLDEMESRMIEKTIRECEGNLSVVAARLGISRQTLYNKIKRYGL